MGALNDAVGADRKASLGAGFRSFFFAWHVRDWDACSYWERAREARGTSSCFPQSATALNIPHGEETPELRHLLLLEELEGQGNVSQRNLAERLGVAVSLVNRLIAELVQDGHIEVVNAEVRPYAYQISPGGQTYLRQLRYARLRLVMGSYRQVRDRIERTLRQIQREGVQRVVFYGSGDVMEVTYPVAREVGLDVVGLVDDDPKKTGQRKVDHVVSAPTVIADLRPDAIVITTFRHVGEIRSRIGLYEQSGVRLVEL